MSDMYLDKDKDEPRFNLRTSHEHNIMDELTKKLGLQYITNEKHFKLERGLRSGERGTDFINTVLNKT
jgi:hypothetical protein